VNPLRAVGAEDAPPSEPAVQESVRPVHVRYPRPGNERRSGRAFHRHGRPRPLGVFRVGRDKEAGAGSDTDKGRRQEAPRRPPRGLPGTCLGRRPRRCRARPTSGPPSGSFALKVARGEVPGRATPARVKARSAGRFAGFLGPPVRHSGDRVGDPEQPVGPGSISRGRAGRTRGEVRRCSDRQSLRSPTPPSSTGAW